MNRGTPGPTADAEPQSLEEAEAILREMARGLSLNSGYEPVLRTAVDAAAVAVSVSSRAIERGDAEHWGAQTLRAVVEAAPE